MKMLLILEVWFLLRLIITPEEYIIMNDDFGSSRTDRNTYFNQAPLYIIIMRYTLYTVFNHNNISFKIPSYPRSPTQKLLIAWVGYI